MATITPVRSTAGHGIEKWFWETLTTGDTATGIQPGGRFQRGSVQVTGTFGSGTAVLQGTNDGTNWATVEDVAGNAISLTAAGVADFDTRYLQYRPNTTGGTADDLDITIILRDA